MIKSLPFTRCLAVVLAAALFRSSTALAIATVPGSLAVLEPPIPLPEMRAEWDSIRSEIYLDPLLLTRGREEVLEELEEWSLAAESIRSSYQTADRITLDRTQVLIDQAWTLYYQFDYDQAARVLGEAKELLSSPGDSGFRTRLMFDVLLLSGITARAAGKKSYADDFKLAAGLDPERLISQDKYSPGTVALYNRLKDELLRGDLVPFSIDRTPSDAVVEVDGEELAPATQGTGYQLRPGKHFLGASAPGYEPWGLTLDVQRFEPANVKFALSASGPEGDPGSFFLQRLKEGDISYLALLAEKLNVDYLLLPDPRENILQAWLIDRTGRTVDHAVLWETGSSLESGAVRTSSFLEPLRQQLDRSRTTAGSPLSFPETIRDPAGDVDAREGSITWKNYAIAIGVVLLIGAASTSGGGTRIEATW